MGQLRACGKDERDLEVRVAGYGCQSSALSEAVAVARGVLPKTSRKMQRRQCRAVLEAADKVGIHAFRVLSEACT